MKNQIKEENLDEIILKYRLIHKKEHEKALQERALQAKISSEMDKGIDLFTVRDVSIYGKTYDVKIMKKNDWTESKSTYPELREKFKKINGWQIPSIALFTATITKIHKHILEEKYDESETSTVDLEIIDELRKQLYLKFVA